MARRGLQDSRGNARARRLESRPEFPAMKAAPREILPFLAFAPAKAASAARGSGGRGSKAYSSACGDRSSAHASSPEVA